MNSGKAKGCHRSQDSLNYTMRHSPNTYPPKKSSSRSKERQFWKEDKGAAEQKAPAQ